MAYTFFEEATENAYVANDLVDAAFGRFYRRSLWKDLEGDRILDIFDPNDPGSITARFRYTGRITGQSADDWKSGVAADFHEFHQNWLESRRPQAKKVAEPVVEPPEPAKVAVPESSPSPKKKKS